MLALAETKLKGNGEVSWCGVKVALPVFRREGVAFLLNPEIDFGCVSSRII